MKNIDLIRCKLCGRFMSNDDVLLGCATMDRGYEEYAHTNCVQKLLQQKDSTVTLSD